MNRTKTLALFAGIFAIAMTTYGLSGVSASPMMMASVPHTQEQVGMFGHVEYTVLDDNQSIKSYLQSDNVVVRTGTDCVGERVFGTTNSATCTSTGDTFDWIGIGNGTSPAAAEDDTALDDDGSADCGEGVAGEQARKQVMPTQVDDGSGSGTVVTLDVLTNTFKFDAGNATTITQSGIFNDDVGLADTAEPHGGQCVTIGATGTDWEMFSIQDLSGGGVQVSDGDSLAVKWTITIT